MSRSQGMSTKRLQTGCFVVSTELGILEKVVYFIVVPCCHVPKPRDVDKKTPNWVFCGVDRAGYFGATGYFGVGWRKFSIL